MLSSPDATRLKLPSRPGRSFFPTKPVVVACWPPPCRFTWPCHSSGPWPLAALLPRRKPIAEGLAAGVVIAAIDLGVVGRRYPLIKALESGPQLADHIAFGIVAAVVLSKPNE